MRIARTLLLLVAMAVASLALTAATASAQETEVEIIDEHSGDACNPCDVHIEGESHITALPAGVIVSSCHDEFEGNLYHDGRGEIEWVGAQHDQVTCALVNCQTGDEPHWPISEMGELGTGEEHAHVRFCLRNPGTGAELHCDAEVHIDGEVDPEIDPDDPRAHHYYFETEQLCAAGTRRVEGHWELESDLLHDEVEIVHHS